VGFGSRDVLAAALMPRETSLGSGPLTVDASGHGQRLDVFLSSRLAISRRDAQELIKKKAVWICTSRGTKRPVGAKSYLLELGSLVEVDLSRLSRALPDPLVRFDVLLESADIVVVDKPAGLPSGAVRGSALGSVASGLLSKYPELEKVGENRYEPGLVHRLDTFTSGALVVARNQATFESLRKRWATEVTKCYLAVSARRGPMGDFPVGKEFIAKSDLGPHPKDASQVMLRPGERFWTRARIVGHSEEATLFDVSVSAAYRHQVRVHMAHLGAPLLGDATYGPKDSHAPRHALHAYYIACENEPTFRVISPLPTDFRSLLGSSLSELAASILDTRRSSKANT
jgi:23S rRNA pseudouridine1911/1915/1917 synthase